MDHTSKNVLMHVFWCICVFSFGLIFRVNHRVKRMSVFHLGNASYFLVIVLTPTPSALMRDFLFHILWRGYEYLLSVAGIFIYFMVSLGE